jgi:hypothetical protein
MMGMDTSMMMDTSTPETSMMETSTPETSMMETSTPETSTPEASVDTGVDTGADTGPDASDAGPDAEPDADAAPDAESDASDAGADVVDAGSDASDAAGDADAGSVVCNTMWPAGTNLITNPDFESGMATGWTADFGGTIAVTTGTSLAHCGMHAGEVTNRTHTYQGIFSAFPTANPGTYNVALWVLQDGTSTVQANIQAVAEGTGNCVSPDAGNAGFLNIAFPMIAPNTWTFVSGTFTVPAACTSLSLVVGNASNGTTFPDILVDDVFVGQ